MMNDEQGMMNQDSRIRQIAELLADEVIEARDQGRNEGEIWCAELLLSAGQNEAFEIIKKARRQRIFRGMLLEVK
jgi:hypothetical protein